MIRVNNLAIGEHDIIDGGDDSVIIPSNRITFLTSILSWPPFAPAQRDWTKFLLDIIVSDPPFNNDSHMENYSMDIFCLNLGGTHTSNFFSRIFFFQMAVKNGIFCNV